LLINIQSYPKISEI